MLCPWCGVGMSGCVDVVVCLGCGMCLGVGCLGVDAPFRVMLSLGCLGSGAVCVGVNGGMRLGCLCVGCELC